MSEQEREEKEDIMKYVISDIHGMCDKYQNMLKLIKFSAEDELYILGDVIHRGEDGIKIMQDIRKHTNMHLIMGNHELMAVQTLFTKDENEWNEKMIVWAMNGGEETYYSLFRIAGRGAEGAGRATDIFTGLYGSRSEWAHVPSGTWFPGEYFRKTSMDKTKAEYQESF